jgi:hypothetical protein
MGGKYVKPCTLAGRRLVPAFGTRPPTTKTATPLNDGVAARYEVRPSGFEPLASSSGGMRSIQLSYGRVLYSPVLARCVGKRISRVLSPARRPEADHFSGTAIAGGLKQPTRDSDGAGRASPLFGLAPGGVCLAAPVASRAVVSYTTVSPLPVPSRVIGGLFSVALSVASRRPAVSRHPALRSSDFPQRLPLPGEAT